MFGSVRRKVALHQIIIISVAMILVFAAIAVYIYDMLVTGIDKKIENIGEAKPFFDERKRVVGMDDIDDAIRRNVLLIAYGDGEKLVFSDVDFFDKDTLFKTISEVSSGESTDRIKINGKYIAYTTYTTEFSPYKYIAVYDYSEDVESFMEYMAITFVSLFIVILVINLFVIHFSNKYLLPIQKAFTKQQELVANASHELKTPITIINTSISILNTTPLTDEQKHWVDGISTQVTRMSKLVNEMLTLARFEAKKNTQEFVKVNFTEVVETIALETDAIAFEKQIDMRTDIAQNIYVRGIKNDLEKLVSILIENAMKYTEKGKTIEIKLAVEKRKAVLRVKNEGDGIPPEQIPKLFDRFYRCDESHSGAEGFGLGLAIAKAIVDNHDGNIGVDSKVGQYTEFLVVLKQI